MQSLQNRRNSTAPPLPEKSSGAPSTQRLLTEGRGAKANNQKHMTELLTKMSRRFSIDDNGGSYQGL
jgi:hypothetical protein